MIHKLSIRNFKSLRELNLDCRRVNVFIGEPNAGKTNVLEAIGLWCPGVHSELRKVCRAEYVSELFYDQDVTQQITVDAEGIQLELNKTEQGALLGISEPHLGEFGLSSAVHLLENLDVLSSDFYSRSEKPNVKYFLFNSSATDDDGSSTGLAPPFGGNLASLLAGNKAARQAAADYFFGSRYRLTVDVGKKRLAMSREEDGALVSFPYSATSETLRRMIFYRLALETSQKCVLAFDEPEANSYPPYTKILAESIAKDEKENQFFLTTHSPYMITSIIAKTPPSELNVFVCRLEGSETKVYPMNEEQRQELMELDMSAFFNLDRFLPELP